MFINIIFILFNVILFLNGLLPIRSKTSNFSDVKYETRKISSDVNLNHTVIMIVDAIRTDFVNDELMPLTTKLIKEHGCLINVSVASPTVTLPRIKSLITGSVPQFMDVLHNLGSPQVLEDSLLHRAKKQGSRIVFHGDDTWLKIFSNHMFIRSSGTTSFFVNDFHEVDDNVTEHVKQELQRNDWNIMILHYLGLDHIGHVHGPFSHLVPPKLHEMDLIFFKIFESISSKNLSSLVILTGDHGMRDSGGHGGSTYSETHVPFGVLGIPCDNGIIDQVDITPNLAVLLGLEIPSSSIGKLTKLLLKKLTVDKFVSALYYNAKLLSLKHGKKEDGFESISILYESYLEKSNMKTAQSLIELCTEYTERVSKSLIESSTHQDILAMMVSVILLCYSFITHLKGTGLFKIPLYNYLFYMFLLIPRVLSYDGIILVPAFLALLYQLITISNCNFKINTHILVFSIFFQPITWLSSSFIEEEHVYWYFLINTFSVFQILKKIQQKDIISSLSWISVSSTLRFAQTLNQVGDKWASLPDSSDFLSENYFLHLSLLCSSFFSIYVFFLKFRKSVYHLEQFILVLILIYKLNVPYHIILARIIYVLLLIYLAVSLNSLNFWVLLISFLLKSNNLCLVPLSLYASRQIFNEYKVSISTTCLHLIMIKSLYFMQGNGNNFANIDITVGYTGLSEYYPVLVGLQLLISTYSTSILMHMLLFISSNDKKPLNFLYIERLYTMIVVCIVSIIFRNHIFIWTVYAPKLCIECCHTLVLVVEFLCYVLISFIKTKKTASDTFKWNIYSHNSDGFQI